MDQSVRSEIDEARKTAMSGEEVDRETLLRFLELPVDSDETLYLRNTARQMRDELFGNKIVITSAIGLDWAPCAGNCTFCSFGEKWGLVKDTLELSVKDVVGIIKGLFERGYKGFTLRTTEFYDVGKLCEMGRNIRKEVPGKFRLGANTGELSYNDAEELYDSGFNSGYHTLRLREGIDTPLDPEMRIRTMKNIKRSRLQLAASIDPLGVEHTNDEILDKMYFLKKFETNQMSVMRRVCVEGTPKGIYEPVSDERMAQIVAVLRIARSDWRVSGAQTSRPVLESGSGGFSIEIGASPRGKGMQLSEWRVMDHDAAKRLIAESGCEFNDG